MIKFQQLLSAQIVTLKNSTRSKRHDLLYRIDCIVMVVYREVKKFSPVGNNPSPSQTAPIILVLD